MKIQRMKADTGTRSTVRALMLVSLFSLTTLSMGASGETMTEDTSPLTAQDWIDYLQLEGHIEGGFFRRIYQADHRPMLRTEQGERYLMTSIYYLLSAQSPIGHFHLNRSDIMHVFVAGDPITYHLIDDETGEYRQVVLGDDIRNGQTPTMMVRGGTWKASEVPANGEAGFGLITEVVSPGFDYSDMTLGKKQDLLARFPQHQDRILRLTHD